MAPFQYAPLGPDPDQGLFRLLWLAPGSGAAPLQCNLTHADLREKPHFDALSYVWGRQDSPELLLCGRGTLRMKANLEQALRSLRHPSQQLCLWVDAVCINQEDLDERAQQVLLMRRIYSGARKVIVWLGSRSDGIEDACRLATNLGHILDSVQPTPEDGYSSFWDLSIIRTLAMAEETGKVESSLFAISELADLFDRPWFVRIWCVQEVVASSRATVRCEDLEIPFRTIARVAPLVHRFRARWFTGKPFEFWNGVALQKDGDTSFSSIEGSVGSLERMLASTRDFEATDPKDKIFALLGFVDDGLGMVGALFPSSGNSPAVSTLRNAFADAVTAVSRLAPRRAYMPKLLKINYDKSTMEVYRDATRFMLRKAPRVADVLCQVQHRDDPVGGRDWPSWVPDWSKSRNAYLLGSVGFFCADSLWLLQSDNGLSPAHPNTLFVDGFVVDRIAKVTDVMEVDAAEQLEIQILWYQLFGVDMDAGKQQLYSHNETLYVAFLMTMIAGELGLISYDGFIMSQPSSSPKSFDELLPRLQPTYEKVKRDASAFHLHFTEGQSETNSNVSTALSSSALHGNAEHYHRTAKGCTFGRRLFLTDAGRLGLAPRVTEPGDLVSVIFGGRCPFILRPQDDHFLLIGDSYLRDRSVMFGMLSETVRQRRSSLRQQTFEIW